MVRMHCMRKLAGPTGQPDTNLNILKDKMYPASADPL